MEILMNEPANGLESPSVSQPFNVIVIAEASQQVKYRKVYFKVCPRFNQPIMGRV